MSNLVSSTNGVLVLANGVNTDTINKGINTLGMSLQKAWQECSDLTVATVVHYVRQKEVSTEFHKGDTSLVTAMGTMLFENNRSMYQAYHSACKKLIGITLVVEDVLNGTEVTGIKVLAELTDTSRRDIVSKFDELVGKLNASSLKALYGPANKAPSNKGGKKAGNKDGSNVLEISPTMKAIEDAGIESAIAEGGEAITAEVLADIKEMIELYTKYPQRHIANDVFKGALNKMRKGLTLSVAVPKAS